LGASAAGGDRRGAAEVREGGFGLDPVKVVAGADEHLAGDLGSNPGKGNGRGGLVHQLMKFLVGFNDLLRELTSPSNPKQPTCSSSWSHPDMSAPA
jgi:hypothetical protein